jgi:hypothetical protein
VYSYFVATNMVQVEGDKIQTRFARSSSRRLCWSVTPVKMTPVEPMEGVTPWPCTVTLRRQNLTQVLRKSQCEFFGEQTGDNIPVNAGLNSASLTSSTAKSACLQVSNCPFPAALSLFNFEIRRFAPSFKRCATVTSPFSKITVDL